MKVSCDLPSSFSLIDTFLYCHREVQYSGKEKSIISAFPLFLAALNNFLSSLRSLFFRLPHFYKKDDSCIVVGLLHVIPSLFLQLY